MSSAAADEREVIHKLENVADNGGGRVDFTADEAAILRKVIKFVRGIEALGWMGRLTKNVLILLGGLLVAWTTFGNAIHELVFGK